MKKLVLHSTSGLQSNSAGMVDCINVLIWGVVKSTKFLKYTYNWIASVIVSAAFVVRTHFQSRRDDTLEKLMSGGVALLAMRIRLYGVDSHVLVSGYSSAIPPVENAIASGENTIPSLEFTIPARENTIPAREFTSASGEFTSSSGEFVSSSGERVIPSGERVIPSGESVSAAGERVISSLERGFPSGEFVSRCECFINNFNNFSLKLLKTAINLAIFHIPAKIY